MKIQINSLIYPSINMFLTPQKDKKWDINLEITNDILDEVQNDVSILMKIKLSDNDKSYVIVQMLGFIRITYLDNADLQRAICVNAYALLYPFLREKVAFLMQMSGIGKPYYLPSCNFIERYEKSLKDNKPTL